MLDSRPVVDSREPEEIRQALIASGWLQKPLPCGDFSFLTCDGQEVGITRKAAPDLLSSIGETFAKQLDEMLDYYDICFLLREGGLQRDPYTDRLKGYNGDSRLTYSALENWLIRFYNKGFSPVLTSNPQHTVKRLCELYALYQKPYSMAARSRAWADERLLALPSGVRGATGQKLLTHFGTLKAIAVANVLELKAVNGIGLKKAELIYRHFNREANHAEQP